MTLQGVICDMDGVLCESEPFILEAAQQMFRERYGVSAAAADFAPFVGTGENAYLGGVAARHGVRLDLAADKARTYELYLDAIRGRLQPARGVTAFLAACRARGFKLAVASSADAVKVRGNLAEIGCPPETFDACVDGLMVARRKPHPDLFLLAAEKIGLPPAACLVVEDAPSGIQAAVAAGARALGVCSSFDAATLQRAGASWTVRDMEEACALLPAIAAAWDRVAAG